MSRNAEGGSDSNKMLASGQRLLECWRYCTEIHGMLLTEGLEVFDGHKLVFAVNFGVVFLW